MTGLAQTLSPRLFGYPGDSAIGEDAQLLREAAREPLVSDNSVFFQDAVRPARCVVRAAQEAAEVGQVLPASTVFQALTLLDALPAWVPAPEITLESDGQIGFDWHLERDRMLSLNVGATGLLGYAAVIGLESSYGRIPFAESLPERVQTLLRLLVEKRQVH